MNKVKIKKSVKQEQVISFRRGINSYSISKKLISHLLHRSVYLYHAVSF